MGFSEVVDAGPDELADHVRLVAHGQPVADRVSRLGAEAEAMGEARAVGRIHEVAVLAVDVIVAGDVEDVHEAVA